MKGKVKSSSIQAVLLTCAGATTKRRKTAKSKCKAKIPKVVLIPSFYIRELKIKPKAHKRKVNKSNPKVTLLCGGPPARRKPSSRPSLCGNYQIGFQCSFSKNTPGISSITWTLFLLNWHLLSYFRSTP